jgi:hypothetical protein
MAATLVTGNPGVTAEMAYTLPCTETTMVQLLRRGVYVHTTDAGSAARLPLRTTDVWYHISQHNRATVLDMWDRFVQPQLAAGGLVLEGPEGVDPLHAVTGLFALASQFVLMSHAMGMPLTVGILCPNVSVPVVRMCMRHALRSLWGPRRPTDPDCSAAGVAAVLAGLPPIQVPVPPAPAPVASQG